MDTFIPVNVIRAIAEDYVKENIPDEYPYFDLLWEQSRLPLTSPVTTADNTQSWIERLLSISLNFHKTQSLAILTPAVILTVSAIAAEFGGKIAIPPAAKLSEAIKLCAKSFGVPTVKAEEMSRSLVPFLTESLKKLSSHDVSDPQPTPPSATPFIAWTADKHGIPLKRKPCDADAVSDLLRQRDRFDILIHSRQVFVRQNGRASVPVDMESVMVSLLTLLLRYKPHELTAIELYENAYRSGEGTPQAAKTGYDEKDILANYLRSPLSRLRRDILIESFAVENKRLSGYRCEGEFTHCVILPSADESKMRVARLE